MTTLIEANVEAVALDWLAGVGWHVAYGPDIAPDTPNPSASTTVTSSWSSGCGTPSLRPETQETSVDEP